MKRLDLVKPLDLNAFDGLSGIVLGIDDDSDSVAIWVFASDWDTDKHGRHVVMASKLLFEAQTEAQLTDLEQACFADCLRRVNIDVGSIVTFPMNKAIVAGTVSKVLYREIEVELNNKTVRHPHCGFYQLAASSIVEVDPDNPLSQWDAKIQPSQLAHHDGGDCSMYVITYRGDPVLRTTEDPLTCDYEDKSLATIGGKPPLEVLQADAHRAMKQFGVKKNCDYYFSDGGVLAQFFAHIRGNMSIKQYFDG